MITLTLHIPQDESEIKAETSLHAFIQENCVELSNVGEAVSIEEESFLYNPMRDRQIHFFHGASPNQDIPTDTELFRDSRENCDSTLK